ncbi:hypothetical protein GCK32_019806, partial [Trichostrongylus colubriformis]
MPPLPQALLAVALLSVTIAVTAAPATDGKVVSSKSSSLREQAKSMSDKKKLHRGKRQVVFEDTINPEDNEDQYTAEDAIRQQLQRTFPHY